MPSLRNFRRKNNNGETIIEHEMADKPYLRMSDHTMDRVESGTAASHRSTSYLRNDSSHRSSSYLSKDTANAATTDLTHQPASDETEEVIYIVRQEYGYCSILFSAIQTLVLLIMMWQCGVAPLSLNPMFGPYPDALSEWGGKNSVLILEDGESYRLLTPIFLHAGVIHLLGNVAVQLETGVFFEKEWGSWRWLTIYFVSAFGSSILSVIAMPLAVSVGSSGAVMGLFGGKLAEVLLRACERKVTKQDHVAHEVRKEQCCMVTSSVIIVMLFSFIPFVDWAAHLGGLVAGFLTGLAIFAWQLETCLWKSVWLCIGLAATVSCFILSLAYMYSGQVETIDELRDVCGYYKENFEEYECNCMRDEYLNYGNNGSQDQ